MHYNILTTIKLFFVLILYMQNAKVETKIGRILSDYKSNLHTHTHTCFFS